MIGKKEILRCDVINAAILKRKKLLSSILVTVFMLDIFEKPMYYYDCE